MPKTRRKVNIIGHRNPDTDSICSALAYTYLKNQLGDAVYEARRAGRSTAKPPLCSSILGWSRRACVPTSAPR